MRKPEMAIVIAMRGADLLAHRTAQNLAYFNSWAARIHDR